jgi:hypothetical protein
MLHVLPVLMLSLNAGAFCLPVPSRSGEPPMSSVVVRKSGATLEELYRSGQPYEAFYAAARARRALWEGNTASAGVPDELLQRARAFPGHWYILAIAVDACSDSVNSIPYVAKLVERTDALGMRIIGPDAGRALMESHRTPDGRTATPTLIVLNDRFEEVGCWIERPAQLQAWYAENSGKLEQSELVERKMAWYREDAGREVIREIVEIVEAAASGGSICEGRRSHPGP